MNYISVFDHYDLDEEGDPKDLSFQEGSDTSGRFPILKASREYVPVGEADSYCVHFAWRPKNEKFRKNDFGDEDGSYNPFAGQSDCEIYAEDGETKALLPGTEINIWVEKKINMEDCGEPSQCEARGINAFKCIYKLKKCYSYFVL